MSYIERRSILGMISSTLFVCLFFIFYINKAIPFDLNPSTIDFVSWGRIYLFFFLYIIVQRVLVLLVHFAIEILILSRKEKLTKDTLRSEFGEDERYGAIDRKASLKIGSILTTGFMVSMLLLAIGFSPSLLFYIMYLSFAFTGIFIEFCIFRSYKKGL